MAGQALHVFEERWRKKAARHQWYYAQIRWAVMVDGKEGLRGWDDILELHPVWDAHRPD